MPARALANVKMDAVVPAGEVSRQARGPGSTRCPIPANVKRWVGELMPRLSGDGDPLGVEELATHHLTLDQAPHAYEIFQRERDGAVKVPTATVEVAGRMPPQRRGDIA